MEMQETKTEIKRETETTALNKTIPNCQKEREQLSGKRGAL